MGEGREPRRGWWAPGLAPGANACVPSGLGMFWRLFLGLKPQALCLRPFRGSPYRFHRHPPSSVERIHATVFPGWIPCASFQKNRSRR